jgi:hypothetical protein
MHPYLENYGDAMQRATGMSFESLSI